MPRFPLFATSLLGCLLLLPGFHNALAQKTGSQTYGGDSFEILESGEGRMDQGPAGNTKTLSGGVVLRYRNWLLRCREVVLLDDDQTARAVGKIMLQGQGGLRIQSERLLWKTSQQWAFFEEDVRCKQGDWSLETPSLRLSTENSEAIYEQGGVLRQGSLRVESQYGQGFLNRKEYRFQKNVVVRHPELDLRTESCRYWAQPDCLILDAQSRIEGLQGSMVGQRGWYQIKSKKMTLAGTGPSGVGPVLPAMALLQNRYLVAGDTLLLDQVSGAYRANGSAQWKDLLRKITWQSDALALDSARRVPSTAPVANTAKHGRQGLWALGQVRVVDESYQPALEWISSSLYGYLPTPHDSLLVWTMDTSMLAYGPWLLTSPTLCWDRQHRSLQANGKIWAWQGASQLESQGMLWKNVGDSLSILDFEGLTGLCEEADSLPWPLYHQASGLKASARLYNNQLRDFELIGNTVTLYWTRGTDSLWSALSRTESARAIFEFQDQQLRRARYVGSPRGTYTPISQIPKSPDFLAGVAPNFQGKHQTQQAMEMRRRAYPTLEPEAQGLKRR
ncbi:MAG: OstA-like protein [Bacteroidota bacterium]